MRFLMGMTAGLALLATPVLAADAAGSRAAAKTDPLKPGKSAGIHAAQQARAGLALVSAGAIIAIVVVAASASNGSGNNNQPNSQSVATTP
jgi:uncharacterized transporter YbjL